MLTRELLLSIKLIAFDFDGVFTDNTVYVDQNGLEAVRCWRSDGLGVARLLSLGVNAIVISTEVNPVVSVRTQKLKLRCKQGVDDKAAAITSVCSELNIDLKDSMFVGNDINDIPAFQLVGVPVGVADSHPDIYPYILYRTQKPGGFGAVREVCDLVINARAAVNRGS